MSEINVKVRSGDRTLYDTKVSIEFEETVAALKKKLCEKDETLDESLVEIVYCGNVMENSSPISAYDVFDGVTVHAFKRMKFEKLDAAKPLSEDDVSRLPGAFRMVATTTLKKFSKSEMINKIILTTPGLSEDPVAITLLQRSELLVKFADNDGIKRIAQSHPALAAGVLKMYAAILEIIPKNHLQSDSNARSMLNVGSDDDAEDIDDSSDGGSNPVSRNASFGAFRTAITAAQLASALASATTQQPQPSTSGASTSVGITENDLGSVLASLQNQQTSSENVLTTQLQIMREMGLTDEAVNLEALRITTDLESAIELVLSGVSLID